MKLGGREDGACVEGVGGAEEGAFTAALCAEGLRLAVGSEGSVLIIVQVIFGCRTGGEGDLAQKKRKSDSGQPSRSRR